MVFIALLCLINFQLINSFLDAQCLTHLYIWLHLIHPLLGGKKKKKSSYCLPTRLAFYSNNIHTVSKSNQFKFTFVTVTRFSWKSNLKAQTEIIQSLSISHTHTQTHTQQLKAIIWLTSPCYCPGAGAVSYGPRWYQGCSKGLVARSGLYLQGQMTTISLSWLQKPLCSSLCSLGLPTQDLSPLFYSLGLPKLCI